MDTNKMREQFEAALVKQAADDGFAKPSLRRNKNNGDYVDPFEQAAWWGWQASREAVVVDLPDAIVGARRYQHAEAAFAHKEGIDECREAIEAQGLRVKP